MLKLAAEDVTDLQVISAHMQDALIKRLDLRFDKKRRRFALVANRYAWDQPQTKQRRRAGLHFDDVLSVQTFGLQKIGAAAVLSLLSIGFEPGADLSGELVLHFSAGIQIRLSVACINVAMADLGGAWEAVATPAHDEK